MGQQSQRRKKGLKACKLRSRRSRYSSRKTRKLTKKEEAVLVGDLFLQYKMGNPKQTTLGFSKRPPPKTVGNGGIVCKRCQLGPSYKDGHHVTCPQSDYYGKNKKLVLQDKARQKERAALPPIVYHGCTSKEKVSFITGATLNKTKVAVPGELSAESKEDDSPIEIVETIEEQFVEDSSNIPFKEEPLRLDKEDSEKVSLANDSFSECSDLEDQSFLLDVYKSMQPDVLKTLLKVKMEPSRGPTYKAKCARPIIEMAKHILSHFPANFEKTTNKLRGGEDNKNRMKWYSTHFPPGTTCFEVPRDNCREKPYGPYSSIVGTKFYFLRWELQDPNICLTCTDKDCPGQLIHDRYDLTKNGYMTPLFSSSGRTSWVISMRYCCNVCDKNVPANDGRLLHQLPHWMQNSYPVSPKYATTISKFQCTKDLTDLLERMMITYGNGPMLAKYLYEKLGKEYVAAETAYYSQCFDTGIRTASPLLCFEDWVGSFSILSSGDNLQDLFGEASRSDLNLSGISDHDRHTREMQAVECFTIWVQAPTFQPLRW